MASKGSTAMVDGQSFTKSCDWRTKTDGTPGPRSAEAQGTVAQSRWQPRAKKTSLEGEETRPKSRDFWRQSLGDWTAYSYSSRPKTRPLLEFALGSSWLHSCSCSCSSSPLLLSQAGCLHSTGDLGWSAYHTPRERKNNTGAERSWCDVQWQTSHAMPRLRQWLDHRNSPDLAWPFSLSTSAQTTARMRV